MEAVTLAPQKTVYVAFLVTERAVLVYIQMSTEPDVSEEDVVDYIRTQLWRSGVGLAEPSEYGVLDLDEIPHRSRQIIGTVEEIVYKINREQL